jgi:hypothetical protein
VPRSGSSSDCAALARKFPKMRMATNPCTKLLSYTSFIYIYRCISVYIGVCVYAMATNPPLYVVAVCVVCVRARASS